MEEAAAAAPQLLALRTSRALGTGKCEHAARRCVRVAVIRHSLDVIDAPPNTQQESRKFAARKLHSVPKPACMQQTHFKMFEEGASLPVQRRQRGQEARRGVDQEKKRERASPDPHPQESTVRLPASPSKKHLFQICSRTPRSCYRRCMPSQPTVPQPLAVPFFLSSGAQEPRELQKCQLTDLLLCSTFQKSTSSG